MRILVHISDLHFGRMNEEILDPLITDITQLQPHLVAVSGDLTQRARSAEFEQAQAFLKALPRPRIVVPGNHDVPMHNVYARFRQALNNYRHYITEDLEPFYADTEIAALGINTARSLAWKGGRINSTQIACIRARLCLAGLQDVTRILVTHHPFDLPPAYRERELVGRARLAMSQLASCRVDLLLAGHLHRSESGSTAVRYKAAGYSAIFIQAGTLSERGRGEPNAFNVVRIDRHRITLERRIWDPQTRAFGPGCTEHFQLTAEGWTRV